MGWRGVRIIAAVIVALAAIGAGASFWIREHGIPWRPNRDRFPTLGIDVSHHNGRIDWPLVRTEPGLRFAWLKATEGTDWVDPRFAQNWAEARANGLEVGAYHFFSFCSPAKDQVDHYVSTVPFDEKSLPPVLDVELSGACRERPDPAISARDVREWLTLVKAKTGRRPIVYTTSEALELFFDPSDLKGTDPLAELWLRSVLREPSITFPADWTYWQFNPRGRVLGVDGAVDLNVRR